MEQEIPVITVVSVMGTTEESAVDPLSETLDFRHTFRKKVTFNSLDNDSSRHNQTVQMGLGYQVISKGRTHNELILQLFAAPESFFPLLLKTMLKVFECRCNRVVDCYSSSCQVARIIWSHLSTRRKWLVCFQVASALF